jgi:transposase-like protein
MKTTEFKSWIEAFDRLSNGQRNKLREKLEEAVNGDKGLDLTERSTTNELTCPHCGDTKIYRWGRSCNLPRYRCLSCKRTFSQLTNTPLAGLPHKGMLINYEEALAQGRVRNTDASRVIAILSGDSIVCIHPHYPAK